DASGRLVASTNGFVVQGRMATNGVLSDTVTDVRLPFGQKSAASATESVSIGGNLQADAEVGATRQTAITVYDAQGGEHELTVTFTKDAVDNEWSYSIDVLNADGVSEAAAVTTGTAVFDDAGNL